MNVFKKLWPYLRPYRGRLLAALIGTTLFTFLSLLPPLLMRALIDRVVQPKAWSLLIPVVLAITFVPIAFSVIRAFNVLLIVQAAQRFLAEIRLAVYEKLLALSMRYHGRHSAGSLITRLMSDAGQLQTLITNEVIQILGDLIIFVFSIAIAFALSWKLALILCVTLVLYITTYRLFMHRIRAATLSYRTITDRIAGRLQETLAGVRQVRIYNREESETQSFLDLTDAGLDKATESGMSNNMLSATCTLISHLGSTAILGLGALFCLRGEISLGDLLALISYVGFVLDPALRLTLLAGRLTETQVAIQRLFEVLDEPVDIVSAPDAVAMKRGPGRIEFRDISFRYTADIPLYTHFSLAIEPGTTVALVGRTGCGKTTLTSLLLRFWDVQAGAVLIDGLDIRRARLDSLRTLFGIVLQDPVIFEGTLAENIAYGRPTATRAEIEAAAQAAELYDTACGLKKGFETPLGTYGVRLSVGEKQRLAIARALLKDPEILIMDEATASLDSESEALIQKALARLLKGRTSLIVAHRLSTIVHSDQIIVLDQGRLIERGRHADLLAIRGGHYAALYEEIQRAGRKGGTTP